MKTAKSLAIVLLLAGAGAAATAAPAAAQKKQRDVITRQEIDGSAMKNLDIFQVIRSLRPHFLEMPRGVRTLGRSNADPIVLYVGGNKQGDISGLKLIMAQDVEEVRYYEPGKAEDEFGAGHTSGAVAVKLVISNPRAPAKPPAR